VAKDNVGRIPALSAAASARVLGAAEQARCLVVTVSLGVLDVGLQAQDVVQALLGEPQQVVVQSLVPVTCRLLRSP
jgi:hypothetical protein